jgi:hypothetical protein
MSGAAPLVQFGDALRITREVKLDERGEVVNVTPRVVVDPHGGYIVADPSESQIRLYTSEGRLRRWFGRRGAGPGEFEHLAAAVRGPDGELLAFEINGRLTVFDSTGSTVLRIQQTRIAPLYHAVLTAGGDEAIITGRLSGGNSSPLVHLYDLRRGSIIRSFFTPRPPRREFEGAYRFSGFSDAVVQHDTVAVLFALSDTLYLFGLDGKARGKISLPFSGFRPIRKPMPVNESPLQFRRWVESFSTASHLYWQPNGTLLVQFFDTYDTQPQWRLLGLRSNGTPLFEIKDSPKLLALSPSSDSLIFVKPGSDLPNVWSIAEVKQ